MQVGDGVVLYVLRGHYGCLYTAAASDSTSIDTSLSTCNVPVEGHPGEKEYWNLNQWMELAFN